MELTPQEKAEQIFNASAEKQEAILIVQDIFNIILSDLNLKKSVNINIIELISKKIAKSCLDKIIKSHIDWATEQDEYKEYYERVKEEIDKFKLI